MLPRKKNLRERNVNVLITSFLCECCRDNLNKNLILIDSSRIRQGFCIEMGVRSTLVIMMDTVAVDGN